MVRKYGKGTRSGIKTSPGPRGLGARKAGDQSARGYRAGSDKL